MRRSKRTKRGKHIKKHNYNFFLHIFFTVVIIFLTTYLYSNINRSIAAIINQKTSSQFSEKNKGKISSNTNKNDKKNDNKKDNKKDNFNLDNCLFIGDSYTVFLKDTIKKNNPNAIVKGVAGVQPGYWNDNFSSLPDNKDVSGVVLLIGVNGVTFPNNIVNKEILIDSLVKKYTDKTIYVEKVFPVGKQFQKVNPATFNKSIKIHNNKIKKYCKKYSNIKFIDTTEGFVSTDGYLTSTNDGLHIRSDKQDIFYKNIAKEVK